MRVVVLDIETRPSALWSPKRANAFPPLPFHIPIAVGCLVVNTDGGDPSFDLTVTLIKDLKDEAPALTALSDLIDDKTSHVVTYSGSGFDLPLLALRASVCKVNWTWWLVRNQRYPRDGHPQWHIDLADHFSNYGRAHYPSLDSLCRCFGLPGKGEVDGGEVETLWKAGKWKTIQRYCAEDVWQTWMLFVAWWQSQVVPVSTRGKKLSEASLTFWKEHKLLKKLWDRR